MLLFLFPCFLTRCCCLKSHVRWHEAAMIGSLQQTTPLRTRSASSGSTRFKGPTTKPWILFVCLIFIYFFFPVWKIVRSIAFHKFRLIPAILLRIRNCAPRWLARPLCLSSCRTFRNASLLPSRSPPTFALGPSSSSCPLVSTSASFPLTSVAATSRTSSATMA